MSIFACGEKGSVVNGLEAAIKNALARSDRTSAEVRARIYQSSREALEAGLRKQNIEDPEIVAGHRQRLEQLIRIIEHDERERLLSLVAEHVKKTTPPTLPVDDRATIGGVLRREPAFDDGEVEDAYVAPEPTATGKPSAIEREPIHAEPFVAERNDPPVAATPIAPAKKAVPRRAASVAKAERAEPRLGIDDEIGAQGVDPRSGAYDLTNSTRSDDSLAFKADPIVVHKKRRGFFARLMIIFTLLAFVVFGAAWIYTSGVLISAQERDQSVPNPPAEIQEEDFDGQEDGGAQTIQPVPDQQLSGGFSADWLEVFNAEKSLGALKAGSMVTVENVKLSSGNAIRVSSRSASQAGELSFDVPVDVMRVLTGRSATIAVTLQSSTDAPAQVAIACDLKNLGHCSRHRFTAMPERSDFLIDAKFTDAVVANASGQITVNADIAGEGRSINIYSVRILPSN